MRRFLAFAAVLAALTPALPAAAQNKIVNLPAEKFAIAPGGVDMRTGRYAYSETDLAGGGGQGAVALTRIMPEAVGNHANPFGNFSHNWDIFLVETPSTTPGDDSVRANVHYGGRSLTFESKAGIETYGYAFKSDGELATLTYAGLRSNGSAVHTMRAPDGTSMTFRPIGGEDCADQLFYGSTRRRCAFVSEMIQPDGTRYTFDYVAVGGAGNRARLARVVSSRGYALLFEGSGNLVTRACLYNLAVAAAPAAGGSCGAGALAAASYAYSGNRLASVTSPGGAVSSFTYPAADKMAFVKPGQGAPWLTHTIARAVDEESGNQEITTRQVFADGQSYDYAYDSAPAGNNFQNAPNPASVVGGTYKDAEQRETVVRYGFPVLPGSVWSSTCTQRPCEVEPESDFQNWTYQQTSGPVELTDPLGRTTTADFCDPVATHCSVVRMQSSTDPEGIKTVYGYDGRGNINKATRYPKPGVTNPDGSSPAPTVVEAAYDVANPKAQDKPLWMKDARGNVTSWTWSPDHGGVLTETGPAVNGVTPQKRYSYVQRQARNSDGSPAGPAVWLLDRMSFCRTGNPSGAGCALGAADEVVTLYDYGADNGGPTNLLLRGQAVVAGGIALRTCFAYDARGRKISETSPKGTAGLSACPASPPASGLPYTTSTRYDSDGQVTGTIAPDPDGPGGNGAPAVRNSYDPAGRLIKVEEGSLAAWQGDWVAPHAWTGFTVHKTINTEYDPLDRKTREWASGAGMTAGVTEYSYDLRGQVKCTAVRMNPDAWATPLPDKCVPGPAHASHGSDRISRNVYDPAGQLIEVWEAVGTPLQRREALYAYNGNGQRTSLTDARGFRAEMTWDGHGRQSRWIFPSKTAPGVADPSDQEYYLYDPSGNRTALRKRDGSILTYQYDASNRLVQKNVPASATGAPGYGVFTGYDNRGLQTYARFGSASGAGVTNAWDGFGRLSASTTTMGGVSRTLSYSYDSDGNRTALQGDGGLSGYAAGFSHDGLGRMTAYDAAARIAYDGAGRRSRLGLGWGADNSSATYGYDFAGRLSSLAHDLGGTSRDVTFGFAAWNPASQLLQRTASNDAYAWTGAQAANRPYSVNGQNQYTVAGPASFAYDANGNLASSSDAAGTTSYVYDSENRLVSASGARNATLAYDPLGRLWRVQGQSATTLFFYDGDRLLLEYDGGGAILRAYTHGPGTDEPIAWNEIAGGAGFRFLHADHQGSIVAVADSSGNPVATNTYDEYGIPGAGNHGRFGYTGQTWIPELGLWYYKARIYSPTLGRFLQTDPIGYDDQINLYAYVGNDPVNNVDSNGMETSHFSRSKIPEMGQPATENFLRGAVSYPRDLYAEIRHVARLSGLSGRAAQNRALLVDRMADRALQWTRQNPQQALETVKALMADNKAFISGRVVAGLGVGTRAGPAAGSALGVGALTGGGVRALNNVAGALEANQISTSTLSSRTVGTIFGAGALGGQVGFDARTGNITMTTRTRETKSRIGRTQTTTVCNVRKNC